jgi:GNAT superfamily N-acetyltransferase
MIGADFLIRRLTPAEVRAAAPALAEALLDCVASGASVSFMADLTPQAARAFWTGVAEAAEDDGRAVIVAEDGAGLFGVVQVIPAGAPNQPHRADVAKMLVHRRGRRRGVGEALMRAAEAQAVVMGKTILTLDTADPVAERLYARCGWTRVGEVPDYALLPDGRLCGAVFFYRRVGG